MLCAQVSAKTRPCSLRLSGKRPMPRAIACLGLLGANASPFRHIEPFVGWRAPNMVSTNSDLPAPTRPVIPRTSPLRAAKLISAKPGPLRASTCRSSSPGSAVFTGYCSANSAPIISPRDPVLAACPSPRRHRMEGGRNRNRSRIPGQYHTRRIRNQNGDGKLAAQGRAPTLSP
jgi:hypothetical protein